MIEKETEGSEGVKREESIAGMRALHHGVGAEAGCNGKSRSNAPLTGHG